MVALKVEYSQEATTMFEIDKEKFGAFVAALRKERGLMQKELAEKLYVSDKAVSKWERGLSIPDVTLLVPLAEILGVSVTELLECRRIPQEEPMDSRQTEDLVKKVIVMTEAEQRGYMPGRRKRGLTLGLCALAGCLEIGLLAFLGIPMEEIAISLFIVMGLMACFGLYFCVFAQEKLPKYYDENKIDAYSDGFLRLNIPGVHFNNTNWPHIVRAVQLWAMIGLVVSPAVFFLLWICLGKIWNSTGVYISLSFSLILTLGGLFVPMYIVGRKYEYSDGQKRQRKSPGKTAWVMLAIVIVLFAMPFLGLSTRESGLRAGYAGSFTGNRWEASYVLHSGFRERAVNVGGGAAVLHVGVTTEDGTFGLRVTDREGNVLYDEKFSDSRSFDIDIPGKVMVRVIGEGHRGAFSISW